MDERRSLMEAVGQRFIDAFNRRDADGLVELCDPRIEFRPTSLVGERAVYRGHDGLRRWVGDLQGALVQHQVRVLEVRQLSEDRFLALAEVTVDGERLSPAALLARIDAEGKIVEARSYLSDEQLLVKLGLAGEQRVDVDVGAS